MGFTQTVIGFKAKNITGFKKSQINSWKIGPSKAISHDGQGWSP